MKPNNEHLNYGRTPEMETQQKSNESAANVELSNLRIEASGFQEGIEGLVGDEIRETGGEDKSTIGDYSDNSSKAQIQDVKAHILSQTPPVKVMVREVRQKLQEELQEVVKLSKNAEKEKDYHKLTTLLAKIRYLTEKIGDLKDASLDYIKKLWLKMVHGIMSN